MQADMTRTITAHEAILTVETPRLNRRFTSIAQPKKKLAVTSCFSALETEADSRTHPASHYHNIYPFIECLVRPLPMGRNTRVPLLRNNAALAAVLLGIWGSQR